MIQNAINWWLHKPCSVWTAIVAVSLPWLIVGACTMASYGWPL